MRRKSDFLYIYCLCDPRDHSEKYIGQTNNLNRRFYEHLYEARTNNLTHKDKWINCLLKKSLFPEIKLIEKIDNTINIPLLNTIQKNIIDVNEELYVDKLISIIKVEDEICSDSSFIQQTIYNIEPSGIRWTRRFKSHAI